MRCRRGSVLCTVPSGSVPATELPTLALKPASSIAAVASPTDMPFTFGMSARMTRVSSLSGEGNGSLPSWAFAAR